MKSSGQRHRIGFHEILYVESIKDYVNIRTENNEFIVLDTLKSMEDQLSEKCVRVHKSFIVNLDKIKSIGAKKVILPKHEIPIGESYRAGLLDRLK
ncbi:MAG: LytTR family transcriptional regulator [Chryseobacterium sp.]|uniref:LytR/AlgR family response regulator transcription factor n=1 Tax=Chryseobacterium sp. TaxID=1871047 RepID=UPI0025BB1354|nr:LytTR family DNA-binding domain-containing protein [Chryseobacterium sp.]MCJ7933715.1 LytTR family transcriptional regulator [Chryseobacterium sp.]